MCDPSICQRPTKPWSACGRGRIPRRCPLGPLVPLRDADRPKDAIGRDGSAPALVEDQQIHEAALQARERPFPPTNARLLVPACAEGVSRRWLFCPPPHPGPCSCLAERRSAHPSAAISRPVGSCERSALARVAGPLGMHGSLKEAGARLGGGDEWNCDAMRGELGAVPGR